jgi:hypothetical protein
MPTQKFGAQEIKGYTPALDVIDDQNQYVLTGTNYTLDASGPRSGYGDRFLEPSGFQNAKFIQGVRFRLDTGRISLTINDDGLWGWDEQLGGFVLIYWLDAVIMAALPHRWTFAYLENLIYMCHPKTGVLVYNLTTGLIQAHSQLANVTVTNAQAVGEISGRLVIMTDTSFVWSNAADGFDLNPQLGGGGLQVLNERITGTPIMLTTYAGGALVWTSGGVLVAQFTGDQSVFKFIPLNTDVRPVNSFCVVQTSDDTTIILDERGLFKLEGVRLSSYGMLTQNRSIDPFDPTMNEYLVKFIRTNALAPNNSTNRLRLEWNELTQSLYVSICGATIEGGYDMCLVNHTTLGSWSQFSEFHYGILPVDMAYGVRTGSYMGYCDSTGRIRFWTNGNTCEASPSDNSQPYLNLFRADVQKNIQYNSTLDGRIMPATIKAHSFDPSIIMNGRSAFYLPEGAAPAPIVVRGLNSSIQIGVFRPTGQSASDETSEVVNVMLRSLNTTDSSVFAEDFELETGSEDLELESGAEDYGIGIPATVGMTLNVIGTLDGFDTFTSQIAELANLVRGNRYYACSVVGVWHILEVSATAVGESYHIKGCELTAASAGRLL